MKVQTTLSQKGQTTRHADETASKRKLGEPSEVLVRDKRKPGSICTRTDDVSALLMRKVQVIQQMKDNAGKLLKVPCSLGHFNDKGVCVVHEVMLWMYAANPFLCRKRCRSSVARAPGTVLLTD